MSSLSEKQRLYGIVPVRCGSKRGTAFLLKDGKLLTAVHVVVEHFAHHSPVLVYYELGNPTRYKAEYVDREGMKDVAVLLQDDLQETAEYAADMYLPLLSIPFEHSKTMNLSVIGYPNEMGHGTSLTEIKVKAYTKIEHQKYDVLTVREGNFALKSYGGFSGSPVVNESGYVVGVVSTENYGKLTYCSIESVKTKLESLGIGNIEDKWEIFDGSKLSLLHCQKKVDEAINRASGRYHEDLHTENKKIDDSISDFTDYNKRKSILKRLEFLANKAAEEIQDAIKAGSLEKPITPDVTIAFEGNKYENLYSHISNLRTFVRPKSIFDRNLKRLEETVQKMTIRLTVMEKQFLCLHGVAGTGKTHVSCQIAKEQMKAQENNVYLLFGSQFDTQRDAWDKMLECLRLTEDDVHQLNIRANTTNHYVVFIIDALNEGAGDLYWKQQLKLLLEKMKPYASIKLIVTIRDPFMVEITNGIDSKDIEMVEIKGFSTANTTKAIDKYFGYYGVDDKYKAMYKRQFKLPLFLIAFCESYWLLSLQERDNLNRRLLYEKYLTSRNKGVSDMADEDIKRNVTLLCMRQLAWHSVEHCQAGLIPRNDARKIADRICPMRTWSNNLLHALLYENLLMDTLSDKNNTQLVMFEFENIADVMKAESLLDSRLNEHQILDMLIRIEEELNKKGLAKAKFDNMVRALIAIWDRPTDVTSISEFTSGRFSYQLVKAKEEYTDERNYEVISKWLRKNRERYNPRDLMHLIDDSSSQLIETLHPYLLSKSISERDEDWTILVNDFLESKNALYYLDRLSHEKKYRRRFLTLITWMLTTSDPDARMYLIRLLFRLLREDTNDIMSLLEQFEFCNDHYLLQGLYCAVYGVMLRSRDAILLKFIAERVWNRYYEQENDVPVDIVLRQWTLKILERASVLDYTANYFYRIRLPFKSQDPRIRMLRKPIPEEYFGKGKGATLLFYSLDKGSDFHRYVIGSNSFAESHELFWRDEDEEFVPVSLYDIPLMMAPIIKNEYKYSTALDRYDADRFSPERHHNKTERIGKKYQWLALDATYARLTDHCWVKDNRSTNWGINVSEKDLTNEAWPWMTGRYDRFDPSLPSNQEIRDYGKKFQLQPEKDEIHQGDDLDFEAWIESEKTHPKIHMQWIDKDGNQWVRLYGYQSDTNVVDKEKRERLLFYNCCFVKKVDSKKMVSWATEKDFSGRWMAERSDCIDFLWNEMPWSDSYKRLKRDRWEEGDYRSSYPCKVLVAYDEQLQEKNYGFLGQEEDYSYSVSMPCGEMMREMMLYTAERGIVRRIKNDEVAAINLGIMDEGIGLLVRKDILCKYMQRKHYHLYCYFHGNKQVSAGSMMVIRSQNLSGCVRMDEKGVWKTVQELRMV